MSNNGYSKNNGQGRGGSRQGGGYGGTSSGHGYHYGGNSGQNERYARPPTERTGTQRQGNDRYSLGGDSRRADEMALIRRATLGTRPTEPLIGYGPSDSNMGNASRAAPTRPGYAEPSRNTSHAGARPGYGDRGGYGERRGTTSQRPGYGERPGYGDHPRPGYGERPSSSAPKGYGAPSGASNAGALAPYISIYESLGPAPRMTKKYAQCISCGGFGRTDRHSACPDCGYGG